MKAATVISNGEEFTAALVNGISAKVKKSYKQNTPEEQLKLVTLFTWRYMADMMPMYQQLDGVTDVESPLDIMSWAQRFAGRMVTVKSYPNWNAAMKEHIQIALTYRCYEPWDWIVGNAAANVEGATVEQFKDLVAQLYSDD
jgi:hypothetical protein